MSVQEQKEEAVVLNERERTLLLSLLHLACEQTAEKQDELYFEFRDLRAKFHDPHRPDESEPILNILYALILNLGK